MFKFFLNKEATTEVIEAIHIVYRIEKKVWSLEELTPISIPGSMCMNGILKFPWLNVPLTKELRLIIV